MFLDSIGNFDCRPPSVITVSDAIAEVARRLVVWTVKRTAATRPFFERKEHQLPRLPQVLYGKVSKTQENLVQGTREQRDQPFLSRQVRL